MSYRSDDHRSRYSDKKYCPSTSNFEYSRRPKPRSRSRSPTRRDYRNEGGRDYRNENQRGSRNENQRGSRNENQRGSRNESPHQNPNHSQSQDYKTAPAPAPTPSTSSQSEQKPTLSALDWDQNESQVKSRDMLLGYLTGGSGQEPPVIARMTRNVGDIGASPRIEPQPAHYKLRTPSDDVKYINEVRNAKPLHSQTIKSHERDETDSDESDDNRYSDPRDKKRPRMGLSTKEDVFMKFNFKDRPVNVEGLPISVHKDKIIKEIARNRITIVEGATGCGKTTQVPQFLIDYHFDEKRRCNIVVTQPRRFAASSLAKRVCEERGWDLGTVVGYQVGMDVKTGPDTLVTYMTTGVLLKKLVARKSLKAWTHIIIDEVHERDLETDLLLLLVKKILVDDPAGKENHVKVILMSATLNSQKFSTYFLTEKAGKSGGGSKDISETPVIKIDVRSPFTVQEFFLDDVIKDKHAVNQIYDKITASNEEGRASVIPELYSYVVTFILELNELEATERRRGRQHYANGTEAAGSVLVFLPGIMEMRELARKLGKENDMNVDRCGTEYEYNRLQILLFHSTTIKEDQDKVFAPPKLNRRKVILATNIAESSITIPDIVYVIDFCLTKSNCVDPRTNFNSLRTCWASVSQCIQRKGRTGRVGDGKVYRMVPKLYYQKLPKDTVPDMRKSSLEYVILQLKMLKIDSESPKAILGLALDPPPLEGIERAVVNLKECGGLKLLCTKKQNHLAERKRVVEQYYDTCDGDLTFLGEVMASLPVSAQCCRLIMLGYCFGYLNEAIIMAAGLSVSKSPFVSPQDKQLEAYLHKLKWAPSMYSDCFALLQAYYDWQNEDSKQRSQKHVYDWARNRFIQVGQMKEIQTLVEDITKRLTELKIAPNPLNLSGTSNPGNDERVTSPVILKEAAIMLKVAIAGAFYPNYFTPEIIERPDENERKLSRTVDGMDLFNTVYFSRFQADRKGELYAQTISNSLAFVKSFPRIKFNGQHVFVNFSNSNSARKVGPIPEDLYRLVKKRLIRQHLELKLLRLNEEQQVYDKLIKKREKRREHILFCPPQTELPGIETKRIKIFVSHVESPSLFWVIEQHKHQIRNRIHEIINENLLNINIRPDSSKLVVNALVLAKFHGRLARARIDFISTAMGKVLIYFIDYGRTEWIEIGSMQPFSPIMLEITVFDKLTAASYPGLAMECRLSQTRPAVIHGSVWHEVAVKKFHKLVEAWKRGLEFKIYAIHESVMYGEFIGRMVRDSTTSHSAENESKPVPYNFNEEMKLVGFADLAPEPFLIEANHSARTRFNLIEHDRRQIKSHNADQIAKPLDLDFLELPDNLVRTVQCKLDGPRSPLELNFQSKCQSTKLSSVTVDGASVNSVSFEHQPTAPVARVLVACSINMQDNKSTQMVARETTIMPGIPGILPLACLLFAPKAELRTNTNQTKYTGVLCGLGAQTTGPVNPDHDVEVTFDAEIDDEDIHNINLIRWDMSVLLREEQGGNKSSFHDRLRTSIFKLLKRKRNRLAPTKQIGPRIAYQWNQIQESFIPPSSTDFPFQPLDVFEPHSTVRFKEEVESTEDDHWNLGC